MSPRGGTRIRATKKPVVVLAGEDGNDRTSMRILLQEFCPQMSGRIVEVNDSVRLREATQQNLVARVNALGRKVRARAAREEAGVACVFVHEDFDRPDGDEYLKTRSRIQEALTRELGTAHYVLSVWEMEAWLLLFPDALAAAVPSWKVPAQYRNRDTGSLIDPKQILKSFGSGGRRYRESDAPALLAKAVALGRLDVPSGHNRSWSQFRADAGDCCRSHLTQSGSVR